MIIDTGTACKYTQYRTVLYIRDLLWLPLQNPIFDFYECDLVV